jgi:hypothetical protein
VLLLFLALLGVELYPLLLEPLAEVGGRVGVGERLEDLVKLALADVDEHVGVGEPFGGPRGVAR